MVKVFMEVGVVIKRPIAGLEKITYSLQCAQTKG